MQNADAFTSARRPGQNNFVILKVLNLERCAPKFLNSRTSDDIGFGLSFKRLPLPTPRTLLSELEVLDGPVNLALGKNVTTPDTSLSRPHDSVRVWSAPAESSNVPDPTPW